jgi:hypothetical protein
MKVSVKDFSVDMEIKNTGIELDVYSPDGETHHGDLIVTKTGMTWCKGRTGKTNGIKITWAAFMKWAEAQGNKDA